MSNLHLFGYISLKQKAKGVKQKLIPDSNSILGGFCPLEPEQSEDNILI